MHLIACADLNWGIGRCGKEIANIPSDKKFFREKTKGQTVIMGAKTYRTLPDQVHPLPGRTNIVLSGNSDWIKEARKEYAQKVSAEPTKMAGTTLILTNSINDVLTYARDDPNSWLIGGGQLYHQFYQYCSDAYITRITCSLGADTFMPNLDKNPNWKVDQQVVFDEESYEYLHYTIYHYKNFGWKNAWEELKNIKP